MAGRREMYSSVIDTVLQDYNSPANTNSVLLKDISVLQTTNDEIINLGMKNLKLSWTGDFDSLQRIVSDYMKFDGKWSSPGGEKKVCSDGDTSITWWKKRKLLAVEGKQAKRITELLIVILTNNVMLHSSDQPGNKDLSDSDEISLVNSCSCKCNSLAVDIEELKLDNVVLESRMEHKTNTNTEIINNVQQELLKVQSKCDMLVDRVGNIENTSYERDSDVIASLECRNKFLAAEVKTLSLKFENLEKKAKADEAMNIHVNIIPSHKTTHADNKRVTSNLVVNDIEQISFVSPVDDSNRKIADSLVNESQKINVDHNTYQNFTIITNKKGTKETHQLGDELDQIQIEASTLLRQDAKNHQHNANHMANDTVQIHKNFVNRGELKVQKHLNKTAYTERPRAADNTVKEPYRRNHQYNSTPINTINPYVNNNDSAEGSLSQNCPIPIRITQRDQKSKRHRGLSRKRSVSHGNQQLDQDFRVHTRRRDKVKYFRYYY